MKEILKYLGEKIGRLVLREKVGRLVLREKSRKVDT
jgi:hypothetical protein